jgi:YfiH family protein
MRGPADCIVPEWPAPTHVKALITTRNGGVSHGPFASFNLGLRAGDDPQAVMTNRASLRRFLPQEPKWLTQQHGAVVVEVDGMAHSPTADAGIARHPGTVCVITVADCVPVLLTDKRGMLVAAAHAGWRGLARGIIGNTVRATGVAPEELLVYLGPAIGPEAFEVGADVYDTFVGQSALAESAFAPGRAGKWYADIYALARLALERAGIAHIYGGGLCTVSDPLRFYSHRRDRITGRMAALVWRES